MAASCALPAQADAGAVPAQRAGAGIALLDEEAAAVAERHAVEHLVAEEARIRHDAVDHAGAGCDDAQLLGPKRQRRRPVARRGCRQPASVGGDEAAA